MISQLDQARYIAIIKENIKGERKGMNVPNYMHSLRVYQRLVVYGFSDEIQLAGLFHDIIEDGGFNEESLKEINLPQNVIDLIKLCTHDTTDQNKLGRWINMVMGLVAAKNIGAWIIKLADITDNLTECKYLSEEKRLLFLNIKAPVMYINCSNIVGIEDLLSEFKREYNKQCLDFGITPIIL